MKPVLFLALLTALPAAALELKPCRLRVYADFLARATAAGLDLETCRKSIRPLPFLTGFE